MRIDTAMRVEGAGNALVLVALVAGIGSIGATAEMGFVPVVLWAISGAAGLAALGAVVSEIGRRAHLRALAKERKDNAFPEE
jgi:hypothetical protein